MKLTSTAFKNGEKIPTKYGYKQQNIHPPLAFSEIPAKAKSLVLIFDDPDVPKGRYPNDVFDHWVLYNIPPNTTHIDEGKSLPHAIQGQNSAQENNYFGPAPPDREHRYFFKLYALDTVLDLKAGATKPQVEQAMTGHILAKAELMGRFSPT